MSDAVSPVPVASDAWLRALSRVMERLTANADREGVLGALADGLVDEFGVALARIWLYHPADDSLRLCASSGLSRNLSGPLSRIDLTDPGNPAAQVIARRETLVRDYIGPDAGFPDEDWVRDHGLRAHLGFPLVIGNRLCGAMAAFMRTPSDAVMVDALGVLARQAALAIENARLLDESHALHEIAMRVASVRDTRALLDSIAGHAATVLGADGCSVWLLSDPEEGLRLAAFHGLSEGYVATLERISVDMREYTMAYLASIERTGWVQSVTRDDPIGRAAADEGIVAALRLPLYASGETLVGLLVLYHRRERVYSDEEMRLARAFAAQIAVTLHNTRLTEQERAAREIAARQEERARLARDLHDSVSQSIFSLGMMARAAQAQAERGSPSVSTTLERISELAQEAMIEMRALLFELHPRALSEEGLTAALDKLVDSVRQRSGLSIVFQSAPVPRLAEDVEAAIFRIVQEALGNAAKHSKASRVSLFVAPRADGLTVTVADDGVGFDPTAPVAPSADGHRGGMGMRSMRERAAAAGLRLSITSAAGEGATVAIEAAGRQPGTD